MDQDSGVITVGQIRTDAPRFYGWLQTNKWKDVLKTLIVPRILRMHSAAPHGLDRFINGRQVAKRQKSLSPKKYDNALLADLIALKLNIAASRLGITPAGFGELLYADSVYIPSLARINVLNNKMIRQIETFADSALMGWYEGGEHLFSQDGIFDNLHWSISRINQAFEGPLDTISFGESLAFTGTRSLIEAPFLRANPDVIPDRIVMPSSILTEVPSVFDLFQNYPNPFNPTTTLSFGLGALSKTSLKVYNVLGQEVATMLDNELLEEGDYEVDFDGSAYPSGVYFYRLIAERISEEDETDEEPGQRNTGTVFAQVRKMLLVK
jgi:hypothetical protein